MSGTSIDTQCRPHRIAISELVPKIQRMTGLPAGFIAETLAAKNTEPSDFKKSSLDSLGVSHQNDTYRLLANEERAKGLKAETSILDAEAFRYIYQVRRFLKPDNDIFTDHPKDKIAEALYRIYFDGIRLYEVGPEEMPGTIPPDVGRWIDFYAKIDGQDKFCNAVSAGGCYCHDLDTCSVKSIVSSECKKEGSYDYPVRSRVLGIDAPERGFIPDWAKDKVIEMYHDMKDVGFSLYASPKAVDVTKYGFVGGCEDECEMIPDEKEMGIAAAKKSGGWINGKLVENSVKIFLELAEKTETFTDDEIFAAVQAIATHEDYRGTVGFAFINGLLVFAKSATQSIVDPQVEESGTLFFSKGTTIRYVSKDTKDMPPWMCGFVEKYDRYLRNLDSYYIFKPEIIKYYLENKFRDDLIDFSKESRLYGKYKYWVGQRVSLLRNSKNPSVQKLAREIGEETLFKPEDVASDAMIAKTADVMRQVRGGGEGEVDFSYFMTLWLVALGLVYPYQKYRNAGFGVLKYAGELAEKAKVGLWELSKSFVMLWDINKKIPRYFPEDCMK